MEALFQGGMDGSHFASISVKLFNNQAYFLLS
jgi:hypothetical protein